MHHVISKNIQSEFATMHGCVKSRQLQVMFTFGFDALERWKMVFFNFLWHVYRKRIKNWWIGLGRTPFSQKTLLVLMDVSCAADGVPGRCDPWATHAALCKTDFLLWSGVSQSSLGMERWRLNTSAEFSRYGQGFPTQKTITITLAAFPTASLSKMSMLSYVVMSLLVKRSNTNSLAIHKFSWIICLTFDCITRREYGRVPVQRQDSWQFLQS